MKTFAERLKYAMGEAGLNQSTLSERTGASKAAISQYLSGKNTPGNRKAHRRRHRGHSNALFGAGDNL